MLPFRFGVKFFTNLRFSSVYTRVRPGSHQAAPRPSVLPEPWDYRSRMWLGRDAIMAYALGGAVARHSVVGRSLHMLWR